MTALQLSQALRQTYAGTDRGANRVFEVVPDCPAVCTLGAADLPRPSRAADCRLLTDSRGSALDDMVLAAMRSVASYGSSGSWNRGRIWNSYE